MPEYEITEEQLEAEEAAEAQTMQQRTQAFYKESGGPGNPRIKKVLDNHLRYGSDHGVSGHMETIEDAVRDVVRGDKSLMTLYQLYMRRQAEREEKDAQRNEQRTDDIAELSEKVERLEAELSEKIGRIEGEIRSLRELLAAVLKPSAEVAKGAGER
jgi:hypothetical protein